MNHLSFEKFAALLFDVDGTLIDSMPIHNRAWIETLAKYGCPLDPKILYELAGVPSLKTVDMLNQNFGWQLDPVSISKEKEALFLKSAHLGAPVDKVVQVVQKYSGKTPLAAVSGGTRENVTAALLQLNLEKLLPVVVTTEDTSRGKPFPDPYLLASKLLGVEPSDCLVFEDGRAGIQSALAAGMSVIDITEERWIIQKAS